MAGGALLLLPLLASAAVASTAPAPAYSRGDFWSYGANGTTVVPLPGMNATVSVQGNRTVRVDSVNASGVATTEVARYSAHGAFPIRGTAVSFYSNLTSVATTVGNRTRGDIWVNVTLAFLSESLRGRFEERVVASTFAFPLATGGRYATVAHVEASVELGSPFPPLVAVGEVRTEYVAGEAREVAVPAGRFTALPLEAWTNVTGEGFASLPFAFGPGNGNATEMFYAPDAGNFVRIVTYDGEGREVLREELVAYSYANSPLRAARPFASPLFWGGVAGAGVAVAAVALLLLRRRRPAPPPPPAEAPGAPLGGAMPPPPEGGPPREPPPPGTSEGPPRGPG